MLIPFYDFMMKQFDHNKKKKHKFMKTYKQKKYKYLKKFTKESDLSFEYMKKKAYNKHNKLFLYSIQTTQEYFHASKYTPTPLAIEYHPENIAGAILYRIIMNTSKKLRIYIPLLSILEKYRSLGYGNLLLDDLISRFSLKHPSKTLEFVIVSLPKSSSFYKRYGFVEGTSSYITKYEHIDDDEEVLIYIHTPHTQHTIPH